jgi:hypothetical protein
MMAAVDGIAKKVLPKRLFFFAAALLIALMPSAQDPMATAAGQRSQIKVNHRDGTLSVHISNMPLVDILQTIGDEAGFKLMVLGSRESRITQNFSNIPLAEGIHRLVGNRSVAIMYQIGDAPDNRKELQDIKEVWVFDSGEAAADSPVSVTQEELLKIDSAVVSSDDLIQSGEIESDAKAESPNDPQKSNPPQPDAAGIKEAATYPQFDKESEVGYWADQLIKNADRSSREQAITELQRIGSDTAVAAIATALGDDDVQLRRHAVESLGRVDNGNAVQLLGQALLGDKDPSVRLSAVRFFANQNSEVSRAFLNTALKDKDKQVQALARQALGNN